MTGPRRSDDPLPDYAWCTETAQRAGVQFGEWSAGLPPVVTQPIGDDLPDAPPPDDLPDLVPVTDRWIRVLPAYWHEGWPYSVPGAWLRPEAAERLGAAVASLPPGFGLAIWDAWRDPRLQALLHDRVYRDATVAPGFVAYPDPDPRRCPPHATGGTVDITLTWRHRPLALGTRFDAFVASAAADALEPDGPRLERDLRRLLAAVMGGAGFAGHPQEWWHWEFGTRMWAARMGLAPRFGHARAPDQGPGIRWSEQGLE